MNLVKKNEFTMLLRSKDNANAMNRITALFKGNKNKKLYAAMNKWRQFIMAEIKKGGGESDKYVRAMDRWGSHRAPLPN